MTGDILADAEAIVETAAARQQEAAARAIAVFDLTPEQATKAVAAYENIIEAGARYTGMPLKLYVHLMPQTQAWGILGYCAGTIVAHEAHEGK